VILFFKRTKTKENNLIKIVTRQMAKENAIGYVSEGWWTYALVFLSVATIILSSSVLDDNTQITEKQKDWALLSSLVMLALVVTYPYIHYRVSGGQFQRIPPRYTHTIAFKGKVAV